MAPKRTEKSAGCCESYWAEINPFQPWWLVHDSSGHKIDIPESFAPAGPMTIIGKLITTAIALSALLVGLLATPSIRFFFAYWTNVSLLLTVFYLLLSFLNTMFPARIQQPSEKVTGRVKWTWILFVAGVHGQVRVLLVLVGSSRKLGRVVLLSLSASSKPNKLSLSLYRSCSSWRHCCTGLPSTIRTRLY